MSSSEEMAEQTWWNHNIGTRLDEFKGWVGDGSAPSKVYMARYLKGVNGELLSYRTLLDAGCGNATFYDTLQKENVDGLEYTGADSCVYFVEDNRKRGIQMIQTDIRKIPVEDRVYDVVFSRHTFEHQPTVEIILQELIRIAKKEMCHIFFLKPAEKQIINWDATTNLYHNTYSRPDIEQLLLRHPRVKTWKWVNLNEQECVLHVYLLE